MSTGNVLIILNTFNRGHLIRETLESIRNQTYTDFECVIIDDFSTDDSTTVINSFISNDPRFSYYRKSTYHNPGLSAGRNYGLEISHERDPEFIQFFDDDDIMHPRKLELQIKALESDSSAKFCLCGSLNFKNMSDINWNETEKNEFDGKYSIGEAYLKGNIRFVAQVPLFRYSYARNFHFDEDLFYAEEWALFSMHFLQNEPEYVNLDRVLFYRRKHSNSITEGHDVDFKKRKTSAITGIKIFDFLEEKNCHTRVTLLYFIRQFLLYRYDSKLLNRIKVYMQSDIQINKFDLYRFQLAIWIHWFFRKAILRLLNF
jgi:glycosyltransferase involved in cell wall biosynthesis